MVAGGAGFLGSHLCATLISQGHHVVCVDNFLTGSMDNLRAISDSPNFTLHEHDIREPFFDQVDQIYNLACPASPPQYQADPIGT